MRDFEQELFTFLFKHSPPVGLRPTLVELRRLAWIRSRSPVRRHFEDSQSAPSGLPAATHAVRRRARTPEPDDYRPRRVRRHGNGEHDARPRLAISGHGPPARALDQYDRAPEERREGGTVGQRDSRTTARSGRQHDDISASLFRQARAAVRARSAAGRHDEHPGARVPAESAVRTRDSSFRAIRRRPCRRAKSGWSRARPPRSATPTSRRSATRDRITSSPR